MRITSAPAVEHKLLHQFMISNLPGGGISGDAVAVIVQTSKTTVMIIIISHIFT